MTQAIIFDCFGVLTTDTWKLFIESLPEGADIESARRAHRSYNAGIMTKQDCAKQIQISTGGRSFTELDDAAGQAFTKNTPLLEYMQELHDRDFKIGILSNIASNWIRDSLLSTEEQALINDFVFSYEVGMVKPEPRMYELACHRLGVEPQAALFIDDKELYCRAARDTGMQAICYHDFAQVKSDIERILAS